MSTKTYKISFVILILILIFFQSKQDLIKAVECDFNADCESGECVNNTCIEPESTLTTKETPDPKKLVTCTLCKCTLSTKTKSGHKIFKGSTATNYLQLIEKGINDLKTFGKSDFVKSYKENKNNSIYVVVYKAKAPLVKIGASKKHIEELDVKCPIEKHFAEVESKQCGNMQNGDCPQCLQCYNADASGMPYIGISCDSKSNCACGLPKGACAQNTDCDTTKGQVCNTSKCSCEKCSTCVIGSDPLGTVKCSKDKSQICTCNWHENSVPKYCGWDCKNCTGWCVSYPSPHCRDCLCTDGSGGVFSPGAQICSDNYLKTCTFDITTDPDTCYWSNKDCSPGSCVTTPTPPHCTDGDSKL